MGNHEESVVEAPEQKLVKREKEPGLEEKPVSEQQPEAKVKVALHSRREWMYLAERIFSHPRYALVVIAALILCAVETYWFVIAPLAIFFTVELLLRIWLQR